MKEATSQRNRNETTTEENSTVGGDLAVGKESLPADGSGIRRKGGRAYQCPRSRLDAEDLCSARRFRTLDKVQRPDRAGVGLRHVLFANESTRGYLCWQLRLSLSASTSELLMLLLRETLLLSWRRRARKATLQRCGAHGSRAVPLRASARACYWLEDRRQAGLATGSRIAMPLFAIHPFNLAARLDSPAHAWIATVRGIVALAAHRSRSGSSMHGSA